MSVILREMLINVKSLVSDGGRYAIIGTVGTLVDIAIFNVILALVAPAVAFVEPVGAKTVSTSVSAVAAYILHGQWTFARRGGRRSSWRMISSFSFVTVLGMVVSVIFIGTAHYILGLQTLAANNAVNLVAIIVSAALRFFLTRHWVFKGKRVIGD